MVFEVRATHRVTPTGEWACEVYPEVFVDAAGRVLSIRRAATGTGADSPVDVAPIEEAGEGEVFVVEDDAVELVVDWIEVLCGDPHAEERMEQRRSCRWPLPQGSVNVLPGSDYVPRLREARVVEFEVRASHRFGGRSGSACEIYPDVFVGQRGIVASRYAGMAMQQPGDIVDALPADEQQWFRVRGLHGATRWVSTVAGIRDRVWVEQHGGETSFFSMRPVGPMGPAAPVRRRLPR